MLLKLVALAASYPRLKADPKGTHYDERDVFCFVFLCRGIPKGQAPLAGLGGAHSESIGDTAFTI